MILVDETPIGQLRRVIGGAYVVNGQYPLDRIPDYKNKRVAYIIGPHAIEPIIDLLQGTMRKIFNDDFVFAFQLRDTSAAWEHDYFESAAVNGTIAILMNGANVDIHAGYALGKYPGSCVFWLVGARSTAEEWILGYIKVHRNSNCLPLTMDDKISPESFIRFMHMIKDKAVERDNVFTN